MLVFIGFPTVADAPSPPASAVRSGALRIVDMSGIVVLLPKFHVPCISSFVIKEVSVLLLAAWLDRAEGPYPFLVMDPK